MPRTDLGTSWLYRGTDLTSAAETGNVFSISALAQRHRQRDPMGFLQWGGGIGSSKESVHLNMAQLMPNVPERLHRPAGCTRRHQPAGPGRVVHRRQLWRPASRRRVAAVSQRSSKRCRAGDGIQSLDGSRTAHSGRQTSIVVGQPVRRRVGSGSYGRPERFWTLSRSTRRVRSMTARGRWPRRRPCGRPHARARSPRPVRGAGRRAGCGGDFIEQRVSLGA